jgi:hypothetical protein
MKLFLIFMGIFLIAGIYSVTAQDLIFLKDGNMVEGKIVETSFSEVKYRYFNNLDGPINVIFRNDVVSIIYENSIYNTNVLSTMYKNGTFEIGNADTDFRKKSSPAAVPQTTDINKPTEADKLIVGINANAGGLIPLGDSIKSSGPSVNIEFIKNSFYSIINLSVPIQDNVGFGFSGIFNYLWKSKIGDFFLGGGLGYTYHVDHFFTFGANAGYRFVTSFGMYFCAGGYIGGKVNDDIMLDIKPVLGVGYSFK